MAETTNNILGPQPDFIRMSELHHSLADEMNKIPNTPQFDTGNAILQALHRIEINVNGLRNEVNGLRNEINGLRNEINEIKIVQRSSDHNQVARVQNSMFLDATDDLSALINPSTNDHIPGFPSKPEGIGHMTNTILNSVLQALGLGTDGSKAVRQQRLRVHIGLRAVQGA